MPRDSELEGKVETHLRGVPGVTRKAMFGGLAYMVDGKLLCGASTRGLMVRLGKGNDAWALDEPGVTTVTMKNKSMAGWVRADPDACEDERLRARLLHAAKQYIATLPSKK